MKLKIPPLGVFSGIFGFFSGFFFGFFSRPSSCCALLWSWSSCFFLFCSSFSAANVPLRILSISKTEFSDWYNRVADSGEVLDIGSLYGDSSNDRVIVHPSLINRLPESVDIISRIQPGEEILNDLAGRIKGGRLGLKSNVAVQIYLKQHEDQWSQWLTEEAYAGVKSAIETGRTGLFRKCLQGNGPNVFYCK